ncbi:hypothetical protein BGZ58_010142 [Dissophora ornata]|nr:hypothetical protein BGZ58_010142 [Dissophora ornata]
MVRLQLSAFNQTFYLHLEPNHDLILPGLDLSGQDGLGFVDDIKAFKGVVVQNGERSRQRWEKAVTTTTAENKQSVEHMQYEEGVLGWARMMIEHDNSDEPLTLRGAFTVNGETYHVTSHQHYYVQKRSDDHSPSSASASLSSRLVIYRDSDLYRKGSLNKRQDQQQLSSCGTDKTHNGRKGALTHGYYYPPNLTSPLIPTGDLGGIFKMGSLGKREDPVMVKVAGPNPIPSGCPTTRMVNYMGVAADCTYVQSYGGLDNARKQILADFNTASGIYESIFNVALGIVSMQIQSMNCPAVPVQGMLWNQECSTNYTMNDRLSDFSYWRGQSGRSKDGAGLWHLMTQCNTGAIVGIAWIKSLCETTTQSQGSPGRTQYTSGTGVSSISPNEWMVVAHEVGHGFGASHDCTSSNCISAQAISGAACCPLSNSTCNANDQYIMNPYEQSPIKTFSPCSINAICSTIASQGKCLQGPSINDTLSTTTNVCGNGVREEGEQCDCGTPEQCASDPCCDGTTCKFKGLAICDDLNDDCCHNCQLAPQGQACRSAISNCDIADTCTGTSVVCPPDVRIPDLTPCEIIGAGNSTLGQGQCAHGICTSRDLQCAEQQRQGITKQCAADTSGCELLCNDPDGSLDTCMKIPGVYFLDGTPCGSSGNGLCGDGQCILPGGWAKNHLQILIPVICVAIILIAGSVGLWVFCACRGRKRVPDIGTSGTSSTVVGKGGSSSSRKETDVPKWMVSSDRRSSQVLTRRDSQVAISRRTSLSAQNVLRKEEGDLMRLPPPATYVQQSLLDNTEYTFTQYYEFQDNEHVQHDRAQAQHCSTHPFPADS